MSTYWNKVWGLGIALERYSLCSDDGLLTWEAAGIRVFLGPLMILTSFRTSHKRPLAPAPAGGETE